MQIWLKNPIHGVKCAYAESEALSDEKNGWVRFDPQASVAAMPTTHDVAPVERKKPGPKPKNRR